MELLDTLIELAKPWARFYSKSTPAQNLILFAHLAGLLGGGGLAIAADRAVWKARAAADDVRARLLADVAAVHRPVLTGLAFAVLSGALMTAADLETYLTSPVWWVKIGAVALLLANGAWLRSIERAAMRAPSVPPAAWAKFTRSSRLSLTLWFVVVFVGVALSNI
ncbi:MAG: hypothetical protein HY944_08725 [Gemmatimonadetes bacterium]|nr:hypothetical protein [Gemmatimonadota bacterium]